MGLTFALFARGQVVWEDTKGNANQYTSYLDNYIVATNSPVAFKTAPGGVEYSKAYIEALIRSKAHLAGLDEDLLVRVARCESGLQMKWNYAHDLNPDYYTAFGVFQIIQGHEAKYGISRLTLEGNIDLAFQLYLDEGLYPWQSSLGCIYNSSD